MQAYLSDIETGRYSVNHTADPSPVRLTERCDSEHMAVGAPSSPGHNRFPRLWGANYLPRESPDAHMFVLRPSGRWSEPHFKDVTERLLSTVRNARKQ
jgi:hypothetical protein